MKYFYFFTVLWTSYFSRCFANVRINEVADKGTDDICSGEDWVELYLPSHESALNLTGYKLHDDNGPEDEDAFVFPSVFIYADIYLLICMNQDSNLSSSFGVGSTDTITLHSNLSPRFGIGGRDTITLRSPDGTVISTTSELLGLGNFNIAYAWKDDEGAYEYTSSPTPGRENKFTRLLTPKERLEAQNAMGVSFFNMDDTGRPVKDGFDEVVDFRMTMKEKDWQYMSENPSFELYSDFTSVIVTSYGKPDDILYTSKSPGQIRPRGQSTLHYGPCFGINAIPFLVDFTSEDSTQTLYGVEKLYLRSHFGDTSYLRDWASNRMLARFGLPHLRARTARLYINDMYMGLYTLMEAVDQKYVFYRSFPDFDFENSALYKVKTGSIGCGAYTEERLAKAYSRMNEKSTSPYSYERGEHNSKVEYVGNPIKDQANNAAIIRECTLTFYENINKNLEDVTLAYVRGGEDCGKMLVDEGLIDRELGDSDWDNTMGEFINKHLGPNQCEPGCEGNDLASNVDTDDFLKNLAVYAVMTNMDSPMGNGNNYFLANTGDGKGWKMVQYDHNIVLSKRGAELCNTKSPNNLIEWSIVTPTCSSFEKNQMFGPLLSDKRLHQIYLKYVEEFIDVITDRTFLNHIQAHAFSLKNAVPDDPWFVLPYQIQMSLDPKYWNATVYGRSFDPFLSMLVARSNEVEKQLQAFD